MMRHRTVLQESLHHYYSEIGNMISGDKGWSLLTKSGIWKVPVEIQYGGKGYGWDGCFAAMAGLGTSCTDHKIFSNLTSHLSSLYLINKHGSDFVKNTYLSRLMDGELISSNEIFASSESNHLITFDKIMIERIVYGILAVSTATSIVNKYKNNNTVNKKMMSVIKKIAAGSDCLYYVVDMIFCNSGLAMQIESMH